MLGSVPQSSREAVLARGTRGEVCEVHHILSEVLWDWCPEFRPCVPLGGLRSRRAREGTHTPAVPAGFAKARCSKPGAVRPQKPRSFMGTPNSHVKASPNAHPRRSPRYRTPEPAPASYAWLQWVRARALGKQPVPRHPHTKVAPSWHPV